MLVEGVWLKPQFIPCGSFCHQGNWHGQVVCWPQPPHSGGEKREKNHCFWSPFFSLPECPAGGGNVPFLFPYCIRPLPALPLGLHPGMWFGGKRHISTKWWWMSSSPGGLYAIDLYVTSFFSSFPVFVQIKAIQKKRFLRVTSNAWSVGKKSGCSPFKGLEMALGLHPGGASRPPPRIRASVNRPCLLVPLLGKQSCAAAAGTGGSPVLHQAYTWCLTKN